MKESTHFVYDGISSKDMGVFIGTTKTGLFEENFLPTRNIVERKIANRDKPYLQRVELDPLSFPLSFILEDWELSNDRDYVRKIARWLFQDYYKPLIFDSNPNRIFYALVEGSSSLFHNGLEDGYVEMNVRCDSPYAYSAEYYEDKIEFSDANISQTISNDIGNFDNGIHDNTITTANGLTVEKPLAMWSDFYARYQKWGDIK